MLDDVQAVADFYSSRRGRVAVQQLRRHLLRIWPDLAGQAVLGIGHATPFLPLWQKRALLCVDASTGGAGSAAWLARLALRAPAAAPARCLVQDDALPFSDLAFDRVLMIHALESATHAGDMLRAAWHALRSDGRVLIVVPNRTGLWAHSESTPFADGTPYSTGRIERLLARCLFRVERMQGALYVPPTGLRPVLRAGSMLEAAGRYVTPRLAGVLVVEAVKDVYAALPVATTTRRVRIRPVLLPVGGVPASRSGA